MIITFNESYDTADWLVKHVIIYGKTNVLLWISWEWRELTYDVDTTADMRIGSVSSMHIANWDVFVRKIHKRNLIFWSQKWILDVLYSSLCLEGVKFCVGVNLWQTCMNNFCTLVFGCQDIKQLQNLKDTFHWLVPYLILSWNWIKLVL